MENVCASDELSIFQEEVFSMSDFKDQNTVVLCDSCDKCPILEREDNQVVVRDDFGGKIVLTGDQWNLLVQLVEQKRFADWTFEPSVSQ
jgi:hypothetical protein